MEPRGGLAVFMAICPHCGQYRTPKTFRFAGRKGFVRCLSCGGEHEYLALPLFVALGASGVGKSTLGLELQRAQREFIVLDGDLLWRQEFAGEGKTNFFEVWMNLALNISQAGKPVLLTMGGMPDDFIQSPAAACFPAVHVMGLYADEEDLVARLRARPEWRGSAGEDFIRSMRIYNAAVSRLDPAINTSRGSVQQCAERLKEFVCMHL